MDLSSLDAGENNGPTGPPRFTTARDDRHIIRITVMDHAVTSRTISQQIQSITHHSVSVRTIRLQFQLRGIS
ncbi:hypothetical protein TNCV_1313701 [Trichonephila clavipes]|nr:hypothetical protein TNCV_1313701 [Trichonephila clavipes]